MIAAAEPSMQDCIRRLRSVANEHELLRAAVDAVVSGNQSALISWMRDYGDGYDSSLDEPVMKMTVLTVALSKCPI
jgi:uncharacterized protein YjfI (DUF2170 family)